MQIKIIKKANLKIGEDLSKKSVKASLMDLGHVMEYPTRVFKKQERKSMK